MQTTRTSLGATPSTTNLPEFMPAPGTQFEVTRGPSSIELTVRGTLSRNDLRALIDRLLEEEAVLKARAEAEFKARHNLALPF